MSRSFQIRCKLKVMSITHRHDKSVVAMQAVIPHSSEPENATFHKYTPSAQLSMEFPPNEVPEIFQPNACYYLDMVRCEAATWPIDWNNPSLWLMMWGITLNGPESRQYEFRRNCGVWHAKKGEALPPFGGEFSLCVDNPETFETFGIEGDILWTFEFVPAIGDYVFYVNHEHHHVLGIPTYDDIVKKSGVEGDVSVVMKAGGTEGDEDRALTRGTFEFVEFRNYVVSPIS